MIHGFIIAAGNQTRFDNIKPKALVDIKGRSCLDININNLGTICDTVTVVCSFENEDYFKDYSRIVIKSGKGCGDAILNALEKFNFNDNDTCFIQWGDCFINNPKLYKKIKNRYDKKSIIIPCTYERNPYVKLEQDKKYVNVYFSKYGEVEEDEIGFHDMSIFYGNINCIKQYCEKYKDIYYNKEYFNNHGDEFNFLDIFNIGHTEGKILPINSNKYKCYAFNTKEEYENIIKEIEDWN